MSPEFWVFLGQLMPTIAGIVRDLFARFRGDADAARAELARIYPHGERLVDAEAEIDRQLADVEGGR